MSRRTEQIAETIRRAVQAVLTEGLADPRLAGLMLTVTTVGVDTDLTTAVIRVSVLPHDREDLALHALKSAARHIRHEVGDRIALHRMPEFMFKLDEGLKKQAEILRALSKVREEAESRPAPNSTDSETPETNA